MGIISTQRTNTETKTHISEKSIRWCRVKLLYISIDNVAQSSFHRREVVSGIC